MLNRTIIACPHCGKEHDCRSPVDDVEMEPTDGDLSFCIDCGKFSSFSGVKLLPLSRSQQEYVDADPDCIKMGHAWEWMKSRN